jgi:hypothetical protein
MVIWDREKQCQTCIHNCGWEEPKECLEDGKILYEFEFDCEMGNACESDIACGDYVEG